MNKFLKTVTVGMLVGFVVSLGQSFNVFAYGNEGGSIGGGGNAQDCGNLSNRAYLSTCFGMTWRYYEWGEAAAGVTYNADGTITIAGDPRGGYAAGTTITGCQGTGGYYRYAMVALRTATINGVTYHAGDQVGTIGIGGSSTYGSEYFGGGGNYIGSNWSEVQGIYQGLQASDPATYYRGWNGGSDLSWFCAGQGQSSNPTTPPPTCGVSAGTTTMTTKVLNGRLRGGYSGWRNNTYAMPTDYIQWYNCYAPGVQTMYGRRNDTLRKAIVDGGTRADYEPGHPIYNFPDSYSNYCSSLSNWTNGYTGSTRMSNHWDNWQNFYTISRNFSASPDNASYFSYGLGDSTGRRRDEQYTVNKTGDVGNTLFESTQTGQPIYFGIWSEGRHYWNPQTVRCKNREIVDWKHNKQYVPWYGYEDICAQYGVSPCGDWYEWDDPIYGDVNRSKELHQEHNDNYIIGSLNTGPTSDYADVKVPFNFINTPYVEIEKSKTANGTPIVYAGDTINLKTAEVNVQGKGNSLTENYYATIVKGAQMKVISFTSPVLPSSGFTTSTSNICSLFSHKRCDEVGSKSGTLNSSGNLGGARETIGGVEGLYQAYDTSAGDYLCFAVAVYPYTSGWDGNLDPSGDRTWAVSTDCVKVAKQPFFGIEGGSLYSIPNVVTGSIGKTNIYGRDDLPYRGKISGNVGRLYFGSYVEQSIFGINTISGLASGSGYLGWIGIRDNDFCKNLVPLTLANAGTFKNKENKNETICGSVQEAGHMGDVDKKTVDKAAYVDFWLRDVINTGDTSYSDGFGGTTKLYSNTGKHIYLTETSRPVISSATIIPDDMTRIVKVKGNTITLNGDIKYNSLSRSITSGGNVSQVIIYAKNINISCNVNEIDAILIAEDTIDTCYENTDHNPNDPRASRRLDVLGVVITDKIYLDRTYGAAIDGYTYSPAELFKYDTSILLWAKYMASAGESNTMTEVYRTEMAPRF